MYCLFVKVPLFNHSLNFFQPVLHFRNLELEGMMMTNEYNVQQMQMNVTSDKLFSIWHFSSSNVVNTSLEKLEKFHPPCPSNWRRWVWNLAKVGRWVMVSSVTPWSLAAWDEREQGVLEGGRICFLQEKSYGTFMYAWIRVPLKYIQKRGVCTQTLIQCMD